MVGARIDPSGELVVVGDRGGVDGDEPAREQVFAAWSDPEQVAAWYGPESFTVSPGSVHIDLRVGGRWELTMVQRDSGRKMPVAYEIVELHPPELLVLRSSPMPEMGMPDGTLTRIELHAHGDKTRMTLSDGPYPAEGGQYAQAGWTAALEKLAGHLGT